MKDTVGISLTRVLSSSALLGLMAPASLWAQGRIEGQVVDGTDQRSVAHQEVRLLSPKEGMQAAATASTDGDGRFSFPPSGIDPTSFYLVETRFQGVAYHAPAQFDSSGSSTVNLTVYDSTRSAEALRVRTLRGLVRVEGTKAQIREEFDLLNASDPPRTYSNPDGTFRFFLSPEAGKPSVVVTGLMNMPLPQTAEPGRSPGEFYIRYPLKPGLTRAQLSYEADYTSLRLALSDRVSYPIDDADIYISPASLSVDSPIFKPAGVDASHNVQKLEARSLRRDFPLELRLAGEAPATSGSEADQAGAEVKITPNSMTRLGGPLLACFLLVLLWALGVRVAKEWPHWQARRGATPTQKQLQTKVDALLNSLADLDELFAARKIAEGKYWKERLELKARLVSALKKVPSSLLESYATRNTAR